MIEWFKNLSEGWQTAIFAAAVAVGLAHVQSRNTAHFDGELKRLVWRKLG